MDTDHPKLTHGLGWLWRPGLIVFLSSACIMVIELVAGRIMAPYVGVSLYTWTSIIGVVLAGISLGNYLGGRIADRRASLRLLGGIFVAGGLLACVALAANYLDRVLFIDRLTASGVHIVVPIVLLALALFFAPCAVLGLISPIVCKLAVRDLERAGSTVGRIYAAGSIGSIVGTFATGFWLQSLLDTHTILLSVAAFLLMLGLLLALGSRPSPLPEATS